jgi:hypothetical protein
MPADGPSPRYRRIAAQYSTVDQGIGEGIRIECLRSRGKSALEHGLNPPRHRGKHTAFEQNRELHILDWIKQNGKSSRPVMRKKSTLTARANPISSSNHSRLSKFVRSRLPGRNNSSKKFPQEDWRVQVSQVFLERAVQNRNEYGQGCTAELVFNLDEVDISDWEDRKARRVVALATMRGQTIHHGISRKVKHISVIPCVFAAGESLIPDMITLQDSPWVRKQLNIHPVRFGTDPILKSNSKPYINAESFLDYVQTVFLPNLAQLRRLDEFAEAMAVLLTDNCLSHITSDMIALLPDARGHVMTFARHTAHNSDLSSL